MWRRGGNGYPDSNGRAYRHYATDTDSASTNGDGVSHCHVPPDFYSYAHDYLCLDTDAHSHYKPNSHYPTDTDSHLDTPDGRVEAGGYIPTG